jgi:SAM-dependent methyltransferase
MDARALPFEEAFDVVGAFDLLEHVPEDEDALTQMRRATVAGGGVLLTVPQHPRLYGYADERAGHVRRYDAGDLRAKIERAGFEVLRMTSFLSLLLPAMALSRARRPRPGSDPLSIPGLELPRPLDALLRGVLAIERGMIRLGVSFPAGGSLLAVGRKPGNPGSGAAR